MTLTSVAGRSVPSSRAIPAIGPAARPSPMMIASGPAVRYHRPLTSILLRLSAVLPEQCSAMTAGTANARLTA